MNGDEHVTFDEMLARVLGFMPDAEVGTDDDGQLVIYTGLCLSSDGDGLDRYPEEEDEHPFTPKESQR